MTAAYIAAGVIYFGYIFSLARRATALRRELDEDSGA
jgi:CcmD family protein